MYILYGYETWSLMLREEHMLSVFENAVLRRIFGPERDGMTGGLELHNEDLHNLFSVSNNIKIICLSRVVAGNKNSPNMAHACRKRRVKWVPGSWGYNWTTLPLGDINTETWSSRVGVGCGANNSTL
jgi:hypothetical protein